MNKSYKLLSKVMLTLVLALIGSFMFATSVIAGEDDAKALLMPLIPDDEIDEDVAERADKLLLKYLSKSEFFEVSGTDDFQEEYGRKKLRKLFRCNDDIKCLLKRLKRADYDIVIVGKLIYTGKEKNKVVFKIVNLDDREVKRSKKFSYRAEKISSKKIRKWAKILFKKPGTLLSRNDDDDDDDNYEPAPRKKSPVFPSKQEIVNGMKEAYLLFVAGDIDVSVNKIKAVCNKPCRCNADRKAITLKAMLVEFAGLVQNVNLQIDSKKTKGLVTAIEQMKAMESNIAAEGKKLGVNKKSKYAKEMNSLFAKAYMLIAKSRIRRSNYVAAKKFLQKALKVDPKNKLAKKELEKIGTKYANRLYRRGVVEIDADPDAALDFFSQVLKLTEKDDELHQKALAKIEEIKEMD